MTLVKVAPNEQQEFKSFDLEINDGANKSICSVLMFFLLASKFFLQKPSKKKNRF